MYFHCKARYRAISSMGFVVCVCVLVLLIVNSKVDCKVEVHKLLYGEKFSTHHTTISYSHSRFFHVVVSCTFSSYCFHLLHLFTLVFVPPLPLSAHIIRSFSPVVWPSPAQPSCLPLCLVYLDFVVVLSLAAHVGVIVRTVYRRVGGGLCALSSEGLA